MKKRHRIFPQENGYIVVQNGLAHFKFSRTFPERIGLVVLMLPAQEAIDERKRMIDDNLRAASDSTLST